MTPALRASLRLAAGCALLAALAPPRPARAQLMDGELHGYALVDRLELQANRGGRPVTLDATGWYGGGWNRLWLRAEVDQETRSENGEAQLEAYYGRLIAPFWDAVVGVRLDRRWGEEHETRAQLALGVTGLAPYWFELQPTLYLSQDGDLSAQLEAEYDLLLTQRLVLQPRLETEMAVQSVPRFEMGSGLTYLELGARLRYELVRELALYLGVSWRVRFGETADLARAAGKDVSNVAFVAGLRAWY